MREHLPSGNSTLITHIMKATKNVTGNWKQKKLTVHARLDEANTTIHLYHSLSHKNQNDKLTEISAYNEVNTCSHI